MTVHDVLDALLWLVDERRTEAMIEVDVNEATVLPLLRRSLGPDMEIAGTYRRLHRWMVEDREVVLESDHHGITCLRIAWPQ